MMLRVIKVTIRRILMYFPALLWLRLWYGLMYRYHFGLRKKLFNQLRFSGGPHPVPADVKGKRILVTLIETNHYRYYQMLILAKALQLRGAEIKILLCGSFLPGCEIKNVNNMGHKDVCLDCRFNQKRVAPLFGLDVIKLPDIISDEDFKSLRKIAATVSESCPLHYHYKGIDIIPMVNDSVIRFFYGEVPSERNLLLKVREDHILSSLIGTEAARKIDEAWSPEIILSNMYVYSAWQPYYEYYRRKSQVEYYSMSITSYSYHVVVLNQLDLLISSSRYRRFIEVRGGRHLQDVERVALKEFLDLRWKGDNTFFKEYECFEKHRIEDLVSIDETKRNIFMFPNVYWDIGMLECGQLFNDVISWVLQTIEMLKDNRQIHLYIKTHPLERFDTLKGTVELIYERYPELPGNVTLIPAELKIKPYDLFPYVDLGVVYNGTTGLEMMLHGIPIVITGKSSYGRLGLAQEPTTLDEYKKVLVGDIPPIMPNKEETELFAYFYFIKTCLPWNLTNRAFADTFNGYTIDSLNDILPGKNKYLDHICNCILDSKNSAIESWD